MRSIIDDDEPVISATKKQTDIPIVMPRRVFLPRVNAAIAARQQISKARRKGTKMSK